MLFEIARKTNSYYQTRMKTRHEL